MDKLFRIIDANINSASEELRVLEDLARFYYDDMPISERLKKIRHNIRKSMTDYLPECLAGRDTINDVGLSISKKNKIDDKTSLEELAAANFKRLQEALRTIEEDLKVLGKFGLSKVYEEYRYASCTLEKDFSRVSCCLTKKQKLNTDLYCITAEGYSCGRNNIEVVKAMINSGVKIIQYREKEKKLLQKYHECLNIRELTRTAGITFIINDDIDIAMMIKADGVHIGQDDLPVEKVRELVGPKMIIGVSTHSPEQAQDAVNKGADYIGVGPIYKTFTKKDVCEPVGLGYLDYVVNNVGIPFVAIGGINENNIKSVLAAGAKSVAIISAIVTKSDVERECKKFRDIILTYHDEI
ncbi:MAG: thiamine phosphate synthase [Candidatus Humimicrobiaceae bacterium]